MLRPGGPEAFGHRERICSSEKRWPCCRMGQSCSWRLFLLRISVYVNLALVDFRVREFITIKDPYWMNQNQSLLMVGEAEVATVVVVVVVAPSCPWSTYLGDWFLGCSLETARGNTLCLRSTATSLGCNKGFNKGHCLLCATHSMRQIFNNPMWFG